MCEAGFEVHVVLVTYDVKNATLSVPAPTMLYCSRLANTLPIAVARFPLEKLPGKAYGTGGTLAAKHRLVFKELLDVGYDLFLSQEDDVIVRPQALRYFTKWAPQTLQTNWYPAFFMFELLTQHRSRAQLASHPSSIIFENLHRAVLRRVRGKTWIVRVMGSRQYMYVLTKEMLLQFNSTWFTHLIDSGEFNPHYTQHWLKEHYHFGVPLEDMPSSYLQNAPNNYINGWVGNPKEINFVFNSAQWEEVVQRCTGEMMFGHHPSQILRPSAIHILPNDVPHPCRRCFRQSKNAEIQVTQSLDLNGASGMARNLTVLAKCDGGQWPKWP